MFANVRWVGFHPPLNYLSWDQGYVTERFNLLSSNKCHSGRRLRTRKWLFIGAREIRLRLGPFPLPLGTEGHVLFVRNITTVRILQLFTKCSKIFVRIFTEINNVCSKWNGSALKNVNNCFDTNFYYYLYKSGGKSYNL